MTNFNNLKVLAAVAILMASCSNDPGNDPDFNGGHDDPAQILLEEFYNSVHPGSRAENPFEIIGMSKKTYMVENDSVYEVPDTRSNDSTTFDVKIATLKFAESQGYSVFSDDERINRVFFFTENGNLADTADIAPLKDLIDYAPYTALETMEDNQTRSNNITDYVYIDEICRFNWGQGSPYNLYASVCNCSKCGGQNPIGCVTIAVGQAIATMGTFHGTYYGNKDLNFDEFLPSYLGRQATMDQKWQVAQFLHEVAHGCQVKYGCASSDNKGSSSTLKSAYRYLRDLGFDCDFIDGGTIDTDRVIISLRKRIPIIMRGKGDKGGHEWLVSGIRSQKNGHEFWCNWGWWGQSNGWTAGNPFTSKDGDRFSKDYKYIYINSKLN